MRLRFRGGKQPDGSSPSVEVQLGRSSAVRPANDAVRGALRRAMRLEEVGGHAGRPPRWSVPPACPPTLRKHLCSEVEYT